MGGDKIIVAYVEVGKKEQNCERGISAVEHCFQWDARGTRSSESWELKITEVFADEPPPPSEHNSMVPKEQAILSAKMWEKSECHSNAD